MKAIATAIPATDDDVVQRYVEEPIANDDALDRIHAAVLLLRERFGHRHVARAESVEVAVVEEVCEGLRVDIEHLLEPRLGGRRLRAAVEVGRLQHEEAARSKKSRARR